MVHTLPTPHRRNRKEGQMPGKTTKRGATPPPAAHLTWVNVLPWRVRRQPLARRAPHDATLATVAAIGGLQAQVMSSAELTLWARVEGLEADTVGRALWDERTLVKTWAMRGTLHLLPSA